VAQMERETGEICWKEAKTKFKDSIVDAATPAIGCAYFRYKLKCFQWTERKS